MKWDSLVDPSWVAYYQVKILDDIIPSSDEEPIESSTEEDEAVFDGNESASSESSGQLSRPFTCRTCGKIFKRREHLAWHKNTHTGAKPYACDRCTLSFACPSNLSVHKKTHFPPKYECEICHKKFTRSDTLRYHRDGRKGRRHIGCKQRKHKQ